MTRDSRPWPGQRAAGRPAMRLDILNRGYSPGTKALFAPPFQGDGLHVGPVACEHGEDGEAGVPVPLLPVAGAGDGAAAHVRVRAEGLEPRAGRPDRSLVPAAATRHLRVVVGDADGV